MATWYATSCSVAALLPCVMQISPNRELVAFGAANIIGAFFQAYPTFGSLTRSAVAQMCACAPLWVLSSDAFAGMVREAKFMDL